MTSADALRKANAACKFPGRVAVVVGATSGIGAAVARRLAQADYTVIAVGRDATRGAALVADCAAASSGNAHQFVACDAALLGAGGVRDCAAAIAAKYPRVDALVLSQGIASMVRDETQEGLDRKLSVHYFSRVAFALALLPQLRAAGHGKVLSVLSGGVHSAYANADRDFELKSHYSIKNAADAAGFYNDAAWDSMAAAPGNESLLFIHAAPGFVNTSWGTQLPTVVRGLVRCLQATLAAPAEDCAEFLCAPLFASGRTGFVLQGSRGEPATVTAQHAAAKEGIWAKTLAIVQKLTA
jgi:NAD(P)-dependent dehydrogenase (short-subunit alcohol dehydrogenase family)